MTAKSPPFVGAATPTAVTSTIDVNIEEGSVMLGPIGSRDEVVDGSWGWRVDWPSAPEPPDPEPLGSDPEPPEIPLPDPLSPERLSSVLPPDPGDPDPPPLPLLLPLPVPLPVPLPAPLPEPLPEPLPLPLSPPLPEPLPLPLPPLLSGRGCG